MGKVGGLPDELEGSETLGDVFFLSQISASLI